METAEAVKEKSGARYRRVTIVEDEATLRRIIARNLVSRGLLVQEAETADEALNGVEEAAGRLKAEG